MAHAGDTVKERPSRRPTLKMTRAEQAPIPPAPGVPTEADPLPAAFAELQRLSSHPVAMPPRHDARRIDSLSFTLPSAYAIPKLMVDPRDLDWFDVNEEALGFLAFVDGVRTISQIADERGERPAEVQLRIADLRDRGVVLLD
jgi:hypothetical protein